LIGNSVTVFLLPYCDASDDTPPERGCGSRISWLHF